MAQKTQNRTPKPVKESGEPGKGSACPIVGVGASAGGLVAFTELLEHLPLDTGMGFVLVQHLDPQHESALTQLLARTTKLPVHEVTDNQRVEPNRVYVIPPNTNLGIVKGVLKLRPRPTARAPHRSIDFFFESLAEDQRERAIGVILSGTATDGTLGLMAIKAEGGITFAQDNSARYDSMPRSAVAAGCVDFVLSPQEIAKELTRIARHPYVAGQSIGSPTPAEDDRADATAHADGAMPLPSGGHGAPKTGAQEVRAEAERGRGERAGARDAEDGFKKVLLLLCHHCGMDFSLYKSTTIQRRITRRMVLNKQDTLMSYARFLQGNAKELDALYSDALISVTSFFRNPEAFDVLRRTIFPKLLERRGDEPFRIWVLGCSTGQEAYSLAMAFVETADNASRLPKLQVFATDLNDALLNKARHGLYAKSLADDVSPERLRRFFVEEGGGYRIVKRLREMVVFARQNFISDPPFSRMDLVSCRNLLIYLEPSLQKKAIPMFHYALKPGGFLFLGASESIGGFTDLFETVDRKHKIYSKKAVPTRALPLPVKKARSKEPAPGPRPHAHFPMAPGEVLEDFHAELNAQREADRITVNQFAPPGVLIDAELQILQFRGSTGAYLEPPAGKASFDVLKMAREGLMLPLRAAIHEAKKENKAVRKENVRMQQNGRTRSVSLEVIPLKNLRERCFLIVFEDAEKAGSAVQSAPSPTEPGDGRRAAAGSRRVADLERELAEMRDYLQSVQEQSEAANEELQASNEEVQSANEELQSINEELETSKEELESANEELTTVNEEMANRNLELNRLSSDLVNIQTSAHLAIVLLGRDLTIRRFSVEAEKQLDLLSTDVGHPLSQVRHKLVFEEGEGSAPKGSPHDLESFIAEVIATSREGQREIRNREGRWYSLRVRPYLTDNKAVDGAVLVLVDIDDLKQTEGKLRESERALRFVMDSMPQKIFTAKPDGDVDYFNPQWTEFTGLPFEEIKGPGWMQFIHPDDMAENLRVWQRSIDTGEPFQFQHRFRLANGEYRWHLSRALPMRDAEGRIAMWIGSSTQIHEQQQMANKLQQLAAELSDADRRKNEFLALLAHELRNPLAPIRNALQVVRLTGDDREVAHSAFEMIERQIGQMVRLVDDLLDMSRISQGKIQIRRERVEIASLVHHAVEACRPALEAANQNLTVTLPPAPLYLHGDPMRIAQVIGNLLDNARKFTGEGGRIWLTIERDSPLPLLAKTPLLAPPREGGKGGSPSPQGGVEESPGIAVIRVRDTGIGIAAEELSHIFETFVQIDTSLERSVSGLGIGLMLVKSLVALHGGTVEAQSAGAGQGSEFVVRLPIRAETPAPKPEPTASELVVTPIARRVLVVDDNPDSAGSLAVLLELAGNETQVAHDGLEAVEAAERFRPEVVLLDIGLPRLNGYDACRRIREKPWGATLVLVALTGWGQEEDRRRSKEAGFDAHLVKPVDYGALMEVLALASKEEG